MDNLRAVLSLRNRLVEKGIKDEFLDELIIIEKSARALEIIKNKEIDVFRFRTLCIIQNMPLFVFNPQLSEKYQLTQEEYELLKEVIGNGKA